LGAFPALEQKRLRGFRLCTKKQAEGPERLWVDGNLLGFPGLSLHNADVRAIATLRKIKHIALSKRQQIADAQDSILPSLECAFCCGWGR